MSEDGQRASLSQLAAELKAKPGPAVRRLGPGEIRERGSSSIHFQVIKPKSGLIGKSSITQEGSIWERGSAREMETGERAGRMHPSR